MNTTLADADLPGSPIGTDRPLRGSGVCPACPLPAASLVTATGATVTITNSTPISGAGTTTGTGFSTGSLIIATGTGTSVTVQ